MTTMTYETCCQCWEQNPAQMQQVFATTDTPQLLTWADRAAADKKWLLASMLNTCVLHKVVAMQLYCAQQAARNYRAPT
jgi:hypothetical protein